MTDMNNKAILDDEGRVIYTREYIFTLPDGTQIVIQDHSAGHTFDDVDGKGDQKGHFNVRPFDRRRTGTVPGTLGHYLFEKYVDLILSIGEW